MDDNLKNKAINATIIEKNIDAVKELEIDDLIGAVSISIRKEIGAKVLESKVKNTAIEWIKVVSKCIPWSREQRYQLDRIVNILMSSKKTLSVSEFGDLMNTEEVF